MAAEMAELKVEMRVVGMAEQKAGLLVVWRGLSMVASMDYSMDCATGQTKGRSMAIHLGLIMVALKAELLVEKWEVLLGLMMVAQRVSKKV